MRTKEQNKKYYEQNKTKYRDKILAHKKVYYVENKESINKKQRERYQNNKESHKKTTQNYYSKVENRIKKLFWKSKERANETGLEFNIEMSDIIIPDYCPYLGIKLTHALGSGQLITNSSIDRIDSTKGYIKGNVQVISRLANTMKSNASTEMLLAFAEGIRRIHGTN